MTSTCPAAIGSWEFDHAMVALVARTAIRDAHLTVGRTRQGLTQRDQVGIRWFADPLAALDVLLAEIAQMSDGTIEAGESQARGDDQYLGDRALLRGKLVAANVGSGRDGRHAKVRQCWAG
jgi:hypothetical protein